MTTPIILSKRVVCCWLLCAMCVGCGGGKESLHEEDHTLPAHWPADLNDAAFKLSDRYARLCQSPELARNGETLFEEFRDLVEWAPNIAADTDLTEQDWNPIYAASESLRGKLTAFGDGQSSKSDVDLLRQLLTEAHAKVQSLEAKQSIGDALGSEAP